MILDFRSLHQVEVQSESLVVFFFSEALKKKTNGKKTNKETSTGTYIDDLETRQRKSAASMLLLH